MTDTNHTRFPHQRLDAYRVAMELFRGVETLTANWPHGHADLKDQMRRSAAATVRNLVEGASRVHVRDKCARFAIAGGECAECAATIEMAEALGLASRMEAKRLTSLAGRVGAMVVGLMRRRHSPG